MSGKVFNVLFLCTESILNADGKGRFRAFSAGSHSNGAVHPCATGTLDALGYPSSGFSSKGWGVFAEPGAPHMDFISTVRDDATGEACPVWLGHPATARWGIEDPAAVEGSEVDNGRAVAQAARYLKTRISLFVNLPLATIDKLSLQEQLEEIGCTSPSGG